MPSFALICTIASTTLRSTGLLSAPATKLASSFTTVIGSVRSVDSDE